MILGNTGSAQGNWRISDGGVDTQKVGLGERADGVKAPGQCPGQCPLWSYGVYGVKWVLYR